ncbi:MAG: hypothetical protein ACLUE8_04720 [Lachnospiraceae bacterium]
MTAKILDGAAMALEVEKELKQRVGPCGSAALCPACASFWWAAILPARPM